MVERKRFSALTSVAMGRNSGGCAWLVRFDRPRPWMAVSAFLRLSRYGHGSADHRRRYRYDRSWRNVAGYPIE
jgi:hypothetical protein